MRWNKAMVLAIAVALTVLCVGCASQPKQGDFSYDTLGALLSEPKAKVEQALGIELDTESQVEEVTSAANNKKGSYTLNKPFVVGDSECKVELFFLNDCLYRFRYTFDDMQREDNFKTAYGMTMDIYSKMKQGYGEPDAAMQGMDSWLGKVESYDAMQWDTLTSSGYQDQWTLPDTQQIRQKLRYTSTDEQIYAQLGFRCWPTDVEAMENREDRGTAYISVGYRSASDLHM